MPNELFNPLMWLTLVVPVVCCISDLQFRRKPRPALYLTLIWIAVTFARQSSAAEAMMSALTGAGLLAGIGLALQALRASDTRVTQCLAAFGLLLGSKAAALVCLFMLVPLVLLWLLYRLWRQFSRRAHKPTPFSIEPC